MSFRSIATTAGTTTNDSLEISGDIQPGVDDATDLGTSTKRLRTGYFSNTVDFSKATGQITITPSNGSVVHTYSQVVGPASVTVALPRGGTAIASLLQYTTAAGTANNTTSAETDLLVGATSTPTAIAAVNSHSGFIVPANLLASGKLMRLKMFGSYSTNGATATIKIDIRVTQTGISVVPGVGTASGTFASAAGPLGWEAEAYLLMSDATHILAYGSVNLSGITVATTVAEQPGIIGTSVVVDPTLSMAICPTWTGSSANAGNNFQLHFACLELLN